MSAQQDLIDSVVGIAPGSPLARLRAQRPDFVRYTQGYHDALLNPSGPGGLSRPERALIALTTAELSGHAGLAAHYRKLLDASGAMPDSPRRAALLDHVRRLVQAPGSATPAHLAALRETGLTATDIVTLSQIVAFVSYQVRVAAGLALLAAESR